MYQSGFSPLTIAARNGHLPMVEYLVERGADVGAKNNVNDVIIDAMLHTSHTNISVNVSGWMDSIDACCMGRSLTDGRISGGERG